MTNIRKF